MHGDAEGSVDRYHHHYGAPLVKSNPQLLATESRRMSQPPYQMDEPRPEAVLEAAVRRCDQAEWHLIAAHVRTNHVHVIVEGQEKPEFMMTQIKATVSRHL
jgi:hypothetical protein